MADRPNRKWWIQSLMEGLAALYARRRLKGNKYVTFHVQNTVVGGKCSLIRSLILLIYLDKELHMGFTSCSEKITHHFVLGCPKDKVNYCSMCSWIIAFISQAGCTYNHFLISSKAFFFKNSIILVSSYTNP